MERNLEDLLKEIQSQVYSVSHNIEIIKNTRYDMQINTKEYVIIKLYAYFESFIQNTMREYVNFLNNLTLHVDTLNDKLRQEYFTQLIKTVRKNTKDVTLSITVTNPEEIKKIYDKTIVKYNDKVQLEIQDTKNIECVQTLNKIFERFGINPIEKFEEEKLGKDDKWRELYRKRNVIAHTDVAIGDVNVEDYANFTLQLVYVCQTKITESAKYYYNLKQNNKQKQQNNNGQSPL